MPPAQNMGTSAGFFGLTYQGPVNGLASNTLSIYNMDHPDDQAWLKLTFDFVAPDGKLKQSQIIPFLQYFYHQRSEGPTQSGSYLYSYPEREAIFLQSLFTEPDAGLGFFELLQHLTEAQDAYVPPSAPLEYTSNSLLRNDIAKHTRRIMSPQQQYRKPLTTSQEVGWTQANGAEPGKPFHLRTSATTQFADAAEKQAWGRSIGGEFSAYATKKLVEFGGFGMGV